ncbi:hypothetical protein KC19_1G018900 [Ceratodon purpureus]|uniref:Peptidase A1 domain-containing protein n=1 Tax=Ceratodon purpureus TaxID=3225 RepID=A0A8T0J378_CERPU|nr:hypothetical protein KC19_1G018900 [Ceratodon purpureus]
MNSSPAGKLVAPSSRRTQPGVRHRSGPIRFLGHWIILILVIALSIGLLPWLQLLKARTAGLRQSYVFFPVYTRDHGLDFEGEAMSGSSPYSMSVNVTTRRLLKHDYSSRKAEKIPPWDPHINTWQVRRHLSEESLLFVRMNVADVTYFLDLDFGSQLIWINCKWSPKDKRGTWSKFVEKFKPGSPLHGPNGLYVPKHHETWCDTRLCAQLNSDEDGSSSCKDNLCYFSISYGKEENIEGIVVRDDAVLSHSCVPSNDRNYRRFNLIFGCVYKRRSKATGKRIKYKEKLGSDGVLGLNQLPLSFPSQLFQENVAERTVVLCLAKTKGVVAGYIVFGFPVKQLGDGVQWVPLERGEGGTYQVLLRNIKYGDDVVILGELLKGKLEIIIDGSVRFTYLADAIFKAFLKIVKRWAQAHGLEFQDIDGQGGACWSFGKATVGDGELRERFKNLKFLFGSAATRREMVVVPENFLFNPAIGLVCLGIRSSDDIEQPGINILGGMTMKERMILMDKTTDRFGWVDDEKCEQNRLAKLRPT